LERNRTRRSCNSSGAGKLNNVKDNDVANGWR
jgi:hypothetical protein